MEDKKKFGIALECKNLPDKEFMNALSMVMETFFGTVGIEGRFEIFEQENDGRPNKSVAFTFDTADKARTHEEVRAFFSDYDKYLKAE